LAEEPLRSASGLETARYETRPPASGIVPEPGALGQAGAGRARRRLPSRRASPCRLHRIAEAIPHTRCKILECRMHFQYLDSGFNVLDDRSRNDGAWGRRPSRSSGCWQICRAHINRPGLQTMKTNSRNI
jgi:hypothetical protein